MHRKNFLKGASEATALVRTRTITAFKALFASLIFFFKKFCLIPKGTPGDPNIGIITAPEIVFLPVLNVQLKPVVHSDGLSKFKFVPIFRIVHNSLMFVN